MRLMGNERPGRTPSEVPPGLYQFIFVGLDGTMYRIQTTDPSVSVAPLTGEEAEREIQRERSRKAETA